MSLQWQAVMLFMNSISLAIQRLSILSKSVHWVPFKTHGSQHCSGKEQRNLIMVVAERRMKLLNG
jgi:hypothetical protein